MAGTKNTPCHPDCPPAGTADVDGVFYHLCCSDPITHEGETLRTASEMQKFLEGEPCQRCGISVFPTAADCVKLKTLLPVRVSGKWTHIGRAHLRPNHGWVKLTGGRVPSHHTWWPSRELTNLCELFPDVTKI